MESTSGKGHGWDLGRFNGPHFDSWHHILWSKGRNSKKLRGLKKLYWFPRLYHAPGMCYLSPLIISYLIQFQFKFPSQEKVIQYVIDVIAAESFNPKTLFLIGTYVLGTFFPSLLHCFYMYQTQLHSFIFLLQEKKRYFWQLPKLWSVKFL